MKDEALVDALDDAVAEERTETLIEQIVKVKVEAQNRCSA